MESLNPIRLLIGIVLALIGYVGPIALLFGVYWLVSLPLRRRERARLFLDLIEQGLDDGHAPEQVIVDAARSQDPMLGGRMQRLAAYLRQGLRLPEALALVPRLVPPEVASMLTMGARTGDLRRVLPACRQVLSDALSQTRGAINYLAITVFVLLPAVPALTWMMSVFVLPKFEQISADMAEGPPPAFTQAAFGLRYPVILFEVLVMVLLQLLVLCYLAGPRLRHALQASPVLGQCVDRFLYLLPWRRHRMQRDFAAMLALLLDAGVPEPEALMGAAEVTNNRVFRRRAQVAAEHLARGLKLPEALRELDRHREFEWRLANAAHGQGGFVAALRGWFEALDARAFQQEQAAAQTLTTAVVIWNGLIVGGFVIAIFLLLVSLIESVALW